MNDLSVRGVYRRYVVEPRIEFFGTDDPAIVGDPMKISVSKDIMASSGGWLRSDLEPLAVTPVGPADWYQNVCPKIVGRISFVQTWTHIDVRIRLDPDAGISASTLASLQATWKAGIESTWNNPIQTPGAAPKPWKCARTAEVPCRISFKVHWATTNSDHAVAVHPGLGATNEKHWYTSDPGSTAAHEFGHMLGHPDEYADPARCPGRSPVGTGTVMDSNTSFIPQRLLQRFADEIGSNIQ